MAPSTGVGSTRSQPDEPRQQPNQKKHTVGEHAVQRHLEFVRYDGEACVTLFTINPFIRKEGLNFLVLDLVQHKKMLQLPSGLPACQRLSFPFSTWGTGGMQAQILSTVAAAKGTCSAQVGVVACI